MKNVLKRELILQVINYKGYNMITFLIPLLLLLFLGKGDFFSYFIGMVVMTTIATIMWEEKQKSYLINLSCPISRREYVNGKFITLIIMSFIGMIVGALGNKLITLIVPSIVNNDIPISYEIIITCILIVVAAIYYTCYYSGGKKLSYIVYGINFLAVMQIIVLSQAELNTIKKYIPWLFKNDIALMILGIMFILVFILNRITVHFYEKKSF